MQIIKKKTLIWFTSEITPFFSPSEHKPSLQEAIKNSMKTSYCYRATLLKNKS